MSSKMWEVDPETRMEDGGNCLFFLYSWLGVLLERGVWKELLAQGVVFAMGHDMADIAEWGVIFQTHNSSSSSRRPREMIDVAIAARRRLSGLCPHFIVQHHATYNNNNAKQFPPLNRPRALGSLHSDKPTQASPKFGTFICLNCAGTHRGLGVHISFVRSITMDAFKLAEIQRMEQGGNEPWKTFFDEHAANVAEGRTFEESTVKERYEGEVGEEWKARLSAKVEGREYVPGEEKKASSVMGSRAGTPRITAAAGGGGRGNGLTPSRSISPAKQELHVGGGGGKKERNEAYFATLGAENASRPENLAPSQGGRYTGFGGGLPPPSSNAAQGQNGGAIIPGLNDFQSDPVAALTKGFGWFTTTVGKGAKTVHESYLQPAAKTLAEADLAAQARLAAAEVSRNVQTGTRGATDVFNRFVEGPSDPSRSRSGSQRRAGMFEPERKDFWDDFAALGEEREREKRRSGAIGTTAVRNSGIGGGGGGSGSGSGGDAGTKGKGKDDDWDDNW
ncbi:hypothetical protein AJ79_08965 [Helicocarpus griseus UAMH5409]|uniref:Arf-GAP domain-containing protein n=1 Tax=Helicocarpus griseus UAMH5409 TaxID=1447875 RepID=A0A2B7WNE0_9EURO|nr:hypothetical protein AJ79_08965 [Helicocarpus griseus UAMH5409]